MACSSISGCSAAVAVPLADGPCRLLSFGPAIRPQSRKDSDGNDHLQGYRHVL